MEGMGAIEEIDRTAEVVLYGALLSHKIAGNTAENEQVLEKTAVDLKKLDESAEFWNIVYTGYTGENLPKPIHQRLLLVAMIICLQETDKDPRGKLDLIQFMLDDYLDPPRELLSLELLKCMEEEAFDILEEEYFKPCALLSKYCADKDPEFEDLKEAFQISLNRNLDALKSAIEAEIDVQSSILADFQSEFTDNLQQILTEYAEHLNSLHPSQMYRKESSPKKRETELKTRLNLKDLGGAKVSKIKVSSNKKPVKVPLNTSVEKIDIAQNNIYVKKIQISAKPKEATIHPRLRNYFLHTFLHSRPPAAQKVAPWFTRKPKTTTNIFQSAEFHQMWNEHKDALTSPKKQRPLSRLQYYSSPH
ncbi:hypothetical protein HDV01_000976 [Terramyces sp. JEL0728]|nr:hypothetical protein HDV01_000976 [Terramyces sp. JEL0728]